MELKSYFAQDSQGNIIPNANVYIYEAGTQALIQNLKDGNENELNNPFQANEDGLIQLYAPNGIYDMRVTSGIREYTLRVSFNDVSDSLNNKAEKNGSEAEAFSVAVAIDISHATPKAQVEQMINEAVVGVSTSVQQKEKLLIAHRGFMGIYPENTMVAFRCALLDGADALETDVSITSDGYRVLLHDSTVDRTSNGTGTITNLTFAYVRGLDFGGKFNAIYAGERIPELSELLALCKEHGVTCWPEIKNVRSNADIDLIVNDIVSAGMSDYVVVQSFSLSQLQYLRTLNQKIKVGFLVGTPTTEQYDALQAIKPAYLLPSYTSVNSAMVTECKLRGLDIATWTVDLSSIKKSMEQLGVTKIMSNYNLGEK